MSIWTRTQYDTLCSSISKGVVSLDLGNGEKVTYRGLDEMLRIKKLMEEQLGIGVQKSRRPGISTPSFSRG